MVKRYIREAAITVDQAQSQGLALRASGSALLLYNPQTMLATLGTEDGTDSDKLADSVLGFLEVKRPAGKEKCHGAMIVRWAAAVKGYGPMMYDTAMSTFGKITSDRIQTSDAAEQVWKYYKDKRGDVQKEPFDDVNLPETPDPNDDCTMQYDRDALNYAYSGARVSVAGLQKNHQNFVAQAQAKFGDDPAMSVDDLLDSAGDAFFRRMY